MKIGHFSFILMTLLVSLLLLTGCRSSLLVHDATVKDIATILEDYAGSHGYKITYRNDALGSYRLSLGNFYAPATSQTTKTKMTTQLPVKDDNQPMTAYEETSWNTVSTPGHYVEVTAMVGLTQQGKDVVLSIDTNNNVIGSSLGDINSYIRGFGYEVEGK